MGQIESKLFYLTRWLWIGIFLLSAAWITSFLSVSPVPGRILLVAALMIICATGLFKKLYWSYYPSATFIFLETTVFSVMLLGDRQGNSSLEIGAFLSTLPVEIQWAAFMFIWLVGLVSVWVMSNNRSSFAREWWQ